MYVILQDSAESTLLIVSVMCNYSYRTVLNGG